MEGCLKWRSSFWWSQKSTVQLQMKYVESWVKTDGPDPMPMGSAAGYGAYGMKKK